MNIFRIASLLVLASPFAGAVIVTLGTSSQTVRFTGDGNGGGVITLGSCSFDGTDTKCVVSGPYTGLGTGGTYEYLLSYPGNGPSIQLGQASSAGSNYLNFLNLTVPGSYITFSLTPTNGAKRTFFQFYSQLSFTTTTCAGVGTCSVAAVGAASGATIAGPVSGLFDVTPKVNSVISAGAYGGLSTIAPGTWIEIYGANLRTIDDVFNQGRIWAGSDFTNNGVQAPTSLGETTVTIGGLSAFVDYVSPTQVNVQVPSGVPAGSQTLVVSTLGGASLAAGVTVAATSPAILAPPVFRLAAGQYAAALFPDATTFVLPPGSLTGIAQRRAKVGDTITFYGIGFGPVTPNINAGLVVQQSNNLSGVQIAFNGVPATIQFAGLVQGLVGLYQFNVVVPNVGVSDSVPVTFRLNGQAASQTLILPVGN
ncbi:MAG: hypothetical protein ABIR70_00080 [Bryobacteraceae bacterium]